MRVNLKHFMGRADICDDGAAPAGETYQAPQAPGAFSPEVRARGIAKAERLLLQGKTWRYLRYLHMREYISAIAHEIETVCVCGAGHGIAEYLVAAEFPHLQVTLTDIVDRKHGYPNYHGAMELSWAYGVDNLHFSIWNVTNESRRSFDLVCSTEMLEHIEQDERAAENMCKASKSYVYCMVPYADKATNADPQRRAKVKEKNEHFVCGYDEDDLAHLFPKPVRMSGAYWQDVGMKWRNDIATLSSGEIDAQAEHLKKRADDDLRDALPERFPQCYGIKVLSRVR